eukprot:g17112.t1
MADEWREAVAGGDAKKLSGLVLLAAGSKHEVALSFLRSCVQLLEQTTHNNGGTPPTSGHSLSPSSDNTNINTNTNTNGSTSNSDNTSSSTAPVLLTLASVQLLQPRGRFDLLFREDGVTVTGKAGTVVVSWGNVRHIIRLPRPEGFNWGKALNPEDPAGSDLLAMPLKDPVPFRKTKTSLVLLQPDPKAKHSEASIVLAGVSHQVSGSQGTLVMSALKLLSGVRQVSPDRGLFASRDGKSFVKCYHGVNEGSLFPLKQGLLFMKPALFLPRTHIEEVVCGRGSSAMTRYVDLVVGLEVENGEGGTDVTQQEFSNIDRELLPCLQSYIQDALVAPRQREVKRAAKAEAAATAGAVSTTTSANASSVAVLSTAAPLASAAAATATPAAGVPARDGTGAGQDADDSRKMEQQRRDQHGEVGEDEDDGDHESDEDFAPVEGDTDSDDDSGCSDHDAGGGNGSSNSSGVSDNDNDNDEDGDDDDDADADLQGDAGSDAGGPDLAAERAEALRELDDLANEAAGGDGSGAAGGAGGSADDEDEEGSRKRKRILDKEEEGTGVEGRVADEQGEDTESEEIGHKVETKYLEEVRPPTWNQGDWHEHTSDIVDVRVQAATAAKPVLPWGSRVVEEAVMVLYVIGLGLGDEKDITVRGLEAVRGSAKVLLEKSGPLVAGADKPKLLRFEAFYGKEIVLADRHMADSEVYSICTTAKDEDVAFLVVGDPFRGGSGVSPTDLVIRARELGVTVEVIQNVSLAAAVGSCGLKGFKFGPAAKIHTWDADSFVDVISRNRRDGQHTLCVLDVEVEEPNLSGDASGEASSLRPPRYMSVSTALRHILEVAEGTRKLRRWCDPDTECVVFSQPGQRTQKIMAGKMSELLDVDVGEPPYSLVICGDTDTDEDELLERHRAAKDPAGQSPPDEDDGCESTAAEEAEPEAEPAHTMSLREAEHRNAMLMRILDSAAKTTETFRNL